MDTRSVFDPDGPAARLPGDCASRLAPAEQKRLEHDLKRHGLSQAEATVIWGEPRTALSALIQRWRPDMIVCDGRTRRMLPPRMPQDGPELVRLGRSSPFARLTGFFLAQAEGRA
jgi:hypothetical protein